MSTLHRNSASFRSIQPAGEGERNPSPPSQKRRKITAVACLQCQRKRRKCDGLRPRCSACIAINSELDCVYETRGNQSRSGALKEKNQDLEAEVTRLRALFRAGSAEPIGVSPGTDVSMQAREANIIEVNSDLSSAQYTPHHSPQSPSSASNPSSVSSHAHHARSVTPDMHKDSTPQSRAACAYGPEPPRRSRASATESFGVSSTSTDEYAGYRKVRRLEAQVAQLRSVIFQHPSLETNTGRPKARAAILGDIISDIEGENNPGVSLPLLGPGVPSPILGPHIETIDPRRLSIQPQLLPGPYNVTPGSSKYAIAGPSSDDVYGYNGVSPGQASESDQSDRSAKRRRSDSPAPYEHKRSKHGNYLEVFGNLPFSSAILANYQPFGIQQTQVNTLRMPSYLIQMLNSDDHLSGLHSVLSPEYASSSFHSFRTYGRHLISQGAPVEGVLGSAAIDVRPLFQTEQYNSIIHTASTFAPWFLGAYPSMTLPSKVACAILISTLLRWQISPTREHYNAMPEWLRATGYQIFVPHTSAFDFMPWPQIRDYLIADGKIPEKLVIVAIMSNLQIDWIFSIEDVFSWDYSTGTATGVSARFQAHVRNIQNWGINAKLLVKYPFLEGMARFLKVEEGLEENGSR